MRVHVNRSRDKKRRCRLGQGIESCSGDKRLAFFKYAAALIIDAASFPQEMGLGLFDYLKIDVNGIATGATLVA